MKKLFVFAIVLASLFTISCNKDEKSPEPTPKPTELVFEGVLKSTSPKGETFTQEGKVEFKIVNSESDTATLWMFKPKFMSEMPARFDMEVGDIIKSEGSDKVTNLSGDNLIPHIGIKPYENYKMTEFKGSISAGETKLSIEFKCIGHTVTYIGDIKK